MNPQPETDPLLALSRRVMDLEACLNYVLNFLPPALKAHAQEVLHAGDIGTVLNLQQQAKPVVINPSFEGQGHEQS